MQVSDIYDVTIERLAFCRPSEEVITADVALLARKIALLGSWTAPVPVEKSSGIIMDGNHRWHAAILLGLTHLPCVRLDYADPRVRVFEWEHDRGFDIDAIFRVVLAGQVFPYKSTRHVFSPALPQAQIPLAHLIESEQKSA